MRSIFSGSKESYHPARGSSKQESNATQSSGFGSTEHCFLNLKYEGYWALLTSAIVVVGAKVRSVWVRKWKGSKAEAMSKNYTLEMLGHGRKERNCQVARISHWDEDWFIDFYFGRHNIMFIIWKWRDSMKSIVDWGARWNHLWSELLEEAVEIGITLKLHTN